MHRLVLLMILALLPSAAQAAVWLVDDDSLAEVPDGQGWATAFPTIQEAVEAAGASLNGPHEVWVAAGLYRGTVTMLPEVSLYGGFGGLQADGFETARSAAKPTANLTVIDGQSVRTCVVGANGTVLDGFTITGGGTDYYGLSVVYKTMAVSRCVFSHNGGLQSGLVNGLFGTVLVRGGDLLVESCTFLGNRVPANGAGLAVVDNATVVVRDSHFESNQAATAGGGISADSSSLTIEDSTFRNNSASVSGGGLNVSGGTLTLEGCQFIGNSAVLGGGLHGSAADLAIEDCTWVSNTADSGGGAYVSECEGSFAHSRFTRNAADVDGGGLYTAEGSELKDGLILEGNSAVRGGGLLIDMGRPELVNSLIYDNLAQTGAGIAVLGGGRPDITNCTILRNLALVTGGIHTVSGITTVTNCILRQNTNGQLGGDVTFVSFSNVQDRAPLDNGNIDEPPFFFDPNTNDFRLHPHSHCVNAGTGVGAPLNDLIGVARPQGSQHDMGAYEYANDDSDGDGVTDAVEGSADGDNDGIPDYLDPDSDNDGFDDDVERALGLDPNNALDTLQDPDGDGIATFLELHPTINTDPFKADTDGGGLNDSEELVLGSDPNDAQDDDRNVRADINGDSSVNALDIQLAINAVLGIDLN